MLAAADSPILVTGATGFVGSHLVERLVGLGYGVRCLARRTSSLAWLPGEGIELAYGEVAENVGLREAVEGVSLVFHVAGVTKTPSSEGYYRGNVQGTANLLRALEEVGSGARFVHVSSLAAVGPSPDGRPLAEDAPAHPVSHYGKSKWEAEEAVRRSPLSAGAVIVRPPVVFGPRDRDVLKFFQAASRGWLFRIGSQEAFVSVVHVSDLVAGLLAAAERAPGQARPYFVANEEPVSWTEFASVAAELMGRQVRAVSIPRPMAWAAGFVAELGSKLRGKPSILSRDKIREARYRYWTCQTARAHHELGFRAEKTLRQGIAETLEWYRMVRWLRP